MEEPNRSSIREQNDDGHGPIHSDHGPKDGRNGPNNEGHTSEMDQSLDVMRHSPRCMMMEGVQITDQVMVSHAERQQHAAATAMGGSDLVTPLNTRRPGHTGKNIYSSSSRELNCKHFELKIAEPGRI